MLELLLAVVLMVIAASSISLFFPKATRAVISNHYTNAAKNLAAGLIQQVEQQPYALIPLTPSTNFAAANCDCNSDDFSVLPRTPIAVDNTTYSEQVCVNLVNRPIGGTWTPTCPDVPLTPAKDKGLKNIRVRVSWNVGGSTQAIDMESVVSRQ